MDDKKIIIILVIILIAIIIVGIVVLNPFMSKTETMIIMTSSNELMDGDQLSISLTDKNGTPIADQIVNITFVDANGGKNTQRIVTDASGNGIFTLSGIASGQYSVDISYGGNDKYVNASTSQVITIKEKQTQSENDAAHSLINIEPEATHIWKSCLLEILWK